MDWLRRFAPLAGAALLCPAASLAGEEGGGDVEELRRRMDEMQRRHDGEMRALRAEIERLRDARGGKAPAEGGGLQESLDDYLDRLEDVEKRVVALGRPKGTVKFIDISLDGLFAVGGSTATDPQLLDLQGGGHDPHKRGFTAQNIELSATGAVDPYFTAEGHIVWFIDPDGETGVELEEMFLTTTSLPWGLQAKAGQYFTEFGRLNPNHPHTWEFVGQPVVNSRMFGGDGMRGPGARLSWLAATSFPLDLLFDVHNANGETMTSFNGPPGEPLVGGHPWASADVASPADFAYTGRAVASFDLAPTTVVLPGLSGSFGPNGTGGRTRILGADLTLKWKLLANDAGFPFFSWQTEYLTRRYAADTAVDPATSTPVPGDVLQDSGMYSQVVWGITRGWTLGARWDWAEGHGGGSGSDPLRDLRTRGSVALTYYPSEFSKVRLEIDRDRSRSLGRSALSAWLQFEIAIGAHGAHKF